MLDWKGDNAKNRLERAARHGIDQTMTECVLLAKETHPFINRTTTAEKSIRIVDGAKRAASGVIRGIWGSVDVIYFIYLELGTRARGISSSLKTRKTIPANKGIDSHDFATLRPVAKILYPGLVDNIRAAWESIA